jgi:hypothetical protein
MAKEEMTVRELAAMGGRARAEALTKEQMSQAMTKAVSARWERVRKSKATQEVGAKGKRRRNTAFTRALR